MVNKCSRIILQNCILAHVYFFFLIKQKKKKKLTENPHFLISCLWDPLFISLQTEDLPNALYITYLYVFVKQVYNTSEFLLCSVFHVPSVCWGNSTWKGGWSGVDFLFPCKTSTNSGKAQTSVWLSQISKSHVCYWC